MKKNCLAVSVFAATFGLAPAIFAQERNGTDEGEAGVSYGATTETRTEDYRREQREQDRFGDAGQVALSAERMFGVGFAWNTVDVDDEDFTASNFNVSVLSNPVPNLTSTYSFPRVGVDYFIADGLSIGAALGFAHSSFDEDDELQGFGQYESLTAILAAPRIGYAFMFNDYLGIWPRAGVTWLWLSGSGQDGTDEDANRFALTVEAPFVISPTEHVAFLVGPTFDLGLSGSNSFEGNGGDVDIDTRATELGIQVGLLAYF